MGGSGACKAPGKSRLLHPAVSTLHSSTTCRTLLGFPGSHVSLFFLWITQDSVPAHWAAPCPALPCVARGVLSTDSVQAGTPQFVQGPTFTSCLLYTSDAADE